jgi:hypothetical protein
LALPQMSTAQEVALLRNRYPDALVCDGCARLVATHGHAGRRYQCAGCTIEAPALARAANERLAALKARPPLPEPSQMTVLAKGHPDPTWSTARCARFEAERLASLSLMGVLQKYAETLTSAKGALPRSDVGPSRPGSSRQQRSSLRGRRLHRRRQNSSPAQLAALARATAARLARSHAG